MNKVAKHTPNLLLYILNYFLLGFLIIALYALFNYFFVISVYSGVKGLLFINTSSYFILSIPFILFIGALFSAIRIKKNFKSATQQISTYEKIISKNTEFVSKIGNGNLNIDYVAEENDQLGQTLTQMRANLQLADLKEEEAKWISTGSAEVSAMLRTHTKVVELGNELIVFLCKKLNAVQAAFYVVEFVEGNEDTIHLTNSFAFSRKKYLSNSFKNGQGLVGQSIIEKDSIYRTEIPGDYVTIKSGLLGDKKPSAIFISPLITNQKAYGAIELAFLNEVPKLHRDFLHAISDIIARTIFNISVNEETFKLLNESRKMTSELEFQRSQLIENATALSEKIEEVDKANKRQQILLEKASEIITIYEADGQVRYKSPSVKSILGYDANELLGINETSKIFEEDKSIFINALSEVKKIANTTKQFQYRYIKQNGGLIWLESTLTNLLEDSTIKGLVMNSRDITEERKAEEEQRVRAKMQALSENSVDLISRVDLDCNLQYVNPVIESVTGLKASLLSNYNIKTGDLLPKELKEEYLKIIELNRLNPAPISSEIKIKKVDEVEFYKITAIPEFDNNKELETILIVAHNVSLQKKSEEIILDKNKKITESINYSYRIQSSLMPTEAVLKGYFENSFMFYKPKDVVSGDFPYIHKNGNKITVASVDCTGHGVPGALMSFIGHFTLNQIMNDGIPRSASEILDELHAQVQATLKQDSGKSDAKDGMDIALCVIDTKNNVLEYAGAHRPCYLVKNKALEELKGDKYPIAGMHYKTRKPFTNYTIKLNSGDAIFINTDGLPDQFGGALGKEKFLSSRVKSTIVENLELNMTEMGDKFEKEFNNWKGNYKQMDDVLLIGIKF